MAKKTMSVNTIIGDILTYAQQHQGLKEKSPLALFISLYFRQLSIEDLLSYATANLYGIAHAQWQNITQRKAGELFLRVYNPDNEIDGWQSTHTIIDLVMDDMPFLVDSVCMELNRLNLTIYQTISLGGLLVQCQQQGHINILSSTSNVSLNESDQPLSVIHIEIDRQSNQQFRSYLRQELLRVLNDVRQVVKDWPAMQQNVKAIIKEYENKSLQKRFADMSESCEFLKWLLTNNFTFLGYRDYKIVTSPNRRALKIIKGSGLGVLYDDKNSQQLRDYADLPEEARQAALSKDRCLIITKTNTRSTIHRPAYTDYVGIKKFNAKGELVGEHRIIGLYTSTAYSRTPEAIPFLRHKVEKVMELSHLPRNSHAGKDLLHILATLPRDDLLQASVEQIFDISMGVMRLQDRRRIRLFARKDTYGRFVSCLVYVPKENFNTDLAHRIQSILVAALEGNEVIMNTHFSESVLARIHYVIRIDAKKPKNHDFKQMESQLIAVGISWQDGLLTHLLKHFSEERANELLGKYRRAFPAGYRETFLPEEAILDIEALEKVTSDHSITMRFYHLSESSNGHVHLKLFRQNEAVSLSDTIPMLENMGFRVLGENSFKITLDPNHIFWINDFNLQYNSSASFDLKVVAPLFYSAFSKVWSYHLENDGFNKLVIAAQLSWDEVTLLRAYAKYFRQVGFHFSQPYIEGALVNNAPLAFLLVAFFKTRFDPLFVGQRDRQASLIKGQILKALDEVSSLDEDRILRFYQHAISASLRTNFFQKNQLGERKGYLSIKIDSKKIPDMPLPLPTYEIFVYSPRLEGIHLRSSKVARGGIRWSDRREDFRVEVLGLMKAQQVKNSVIVPSGAKGGFVTKALTKKATREEMIKEGVACYQDYIRGLLDITDNLKSNTVEKPSSVVCYDGDDSYLVVAADKGTATFSDLANQIALDYDYWLGDAFASGGSTGYDHKKMGITARGAWHSARRHFLDLNINVDENEIRVVGIGDMAGDVFGNGMLLSSHIKLVAAFNHQHIFIDPDPIPKASFLERQRLFALPRSNWEDYNPKIISQGGGVFKRSAKSIRLSSAMKQLLTINVEVITPNELIKAILKAPVDLLWNGGIGTFVKASYETHEQVGDRTNDTIRINAKDLRTRVVCEGGNLGLTQPARIEYECNGGKVNTDFIDNSAGVDCSDHEVNTKILLDSVILSGGLTQKQRNHLLIKMTDEVSKLVLANNYHQNQSISLASVMSPNRMSLYTAYIKHRETQGLIDRDLEFLPDDKVLQERKANSKGLTRPELAILLSYSKMILKKAILESELVDECYLSRYLCLAFPRIICERYMDVLKQHYLYREIIATQLSNCLVADMGITFIYQMQDETGASVAAIVRAYIITKEIFNIASIHATVDKLDYIVSANVQYQIILSGIRLMRRSVRWLLRHRSEKMNIEETIDYFSPWIARVYHRLPKLLVGKVQEVFDQQKQKLMHSHVPESVVSYAASASFIYHALNIVEAAKVSNHELYRVAKIYFILVDRLELSSVRACINAYPADSRWAVCARAAFRGDLDWLQREMTLAILKYDTPARSIPGRINAWFESNRLLIDRVKEVIGELLSADAPDFAILSVAIRELMELAKTSHHECC